MPTAATTRPSCPRSRPDAHPHRAAETFAGGLIAFTRERLAGYETPERVVFAAVVPETLGGEIREHELRSEPA